MKTTNKLLALAIMAVAMVFASCSKDDNDPVIPTQQEIEAKIVGKWKYVETRGEKVLTDQRSVTTYLADGKEVASTAKTHEMEGFVWSNKESYLYQVTGNHVKVIRLSNGMILYTDFTSISDNRFEKVLTKVVCSDGRVRQLNQSTVFAKVTADYSHDIVGMWEGVDMTGYETYGDAHHRIEYRADGTYTYYNWDETTQTWKPLGDVFDEWNVDGDWLATRWQNNGSDVMNYEWWDIDYIKKEGDDIIMKWSALREKEGGERFTTTFTWKKVEMKD